MFVDRSAACRLSPPPPRRPKQIHASFLLIRRLSTSATTPVVLWPLDQEQVVARWVAVGDMTSPSAPPGVLVGIARTLWRHPSPAAPPRFAGSPAATRQASPSPPAATREHRCGRETSRARRRSRWAPTVRRVAALWGFPSDRPCLFCLRNLLADAARWRGCA